MNRDEKKTWMIFLIVFGAFFLFSLGGLLGSIAGDAPQWDTVTGASGAFFGTIFVIWLFRVTYFAGKRNR